MAGKAWLASAKVMYDHMGLRAERSRTVRGVRLGNRKLKAWHHSQQNLPQYNVLNHLGWVSSTWAQGKEGLLAGWRDRWAAGTGPGSVTEQQGTWGLALSFYYQASAGIVMRNFLHFEVAAWQAGSSLRSQSPHL